jgi:nucleoid-associated protein YgaU
VASLLPINSAPIREVSILNLKNILKAFRLNESTISMFLGALVIVITGILVVNYFKGKDVANKLPEVTSENKTEAKVGQTYTVQKGDNLWTISEKAYGSGYNWVDVAKQNNIDNSDIISEGTEIIIPDVEPKLATTENTIESENPGENTQAIPETTYQIQKGDNLWDICVRAYGDGYKWVEVSKANKLANPNLIYPDNILVLPR